MDLEKDLNFWQVLIQIGKPHVRDNGDGGLGYPCQRFRQKSFNSVKVESSISEGVLNKASSLEFMVDPLMPVLNAWMKRKPSCLHEFHLANRGASSCSHSSCSPAVVSSMYESFCKDTFLLISAFMFRIIRVSLDEFFFTWWLLSGQEDSVHYMEIHAEFKLSFEVSVVRFPDYHLKIGAIKVNVEEGVAWIRDEQVADVGEGDCLGYHVYFLA